MSQTRKDLSSDPETARLLSVTTTQCTMPVCPRSVASTRPSGIFHTFTVPSDDPDTRYGNARQSDHTGPAWSRSCLGGERGGGRGDRPELRRVGGARDEEEEELVDFGDCGTERDEAPVELALVPTVRVLEVLGGRPAWLAGAGVPCAGGGVDRRPVRLALARLLREPRAVPTGVLGGVRVLALRCCCCFARGLEPPVADATGVGEEGKR
mmetsp:Transcript_14276/g.44943  ORF Transcript_14276/g.44943 Transcript_14276/m.44943 type:complete len:210 (+) Transcript_14276:676-1305(+)